MALVGEMRYGLWQGGDSTKDGQVPFEGIPEVIETGVREHVAAELFSATPAADDLVTMSTRG
eukprot:1842168-Alexandrium_andersonii.AAC.1